MVHCLDDMLANNYNLRTAIALMNDVIAIFEIMVTSGLESPNVDNKHVRLIWQELVRDGTKVPKAIKDVKGASFPVRINRNISKICLM